MLQWTPLEIGKADSPQALLQRTEQAVRWLQLKQGADIIAGKQALSGATLAAHKDLLVDPPEDPDDPVPPETSVEEQPKTTEPVVRYRKRRVQRYSVQTACSAHVRLSAAAAF